jgi:hypothetical protein
MIITHRVCPELPTQITTGYKSPIQIARVITEQRLQDNMYCPSYVRY